MPEGCRLTIVSDSCHSGGLIDDAKEQIGESTNSNQEEPKSHSHGISSFFKNKIKDSARDAFESRGIHVPSELHRHLGHPSEEPKVVEEGYEDHHGYIKSKSLPLSTLIDILKQQTGKDDIDVGKLRPTLFDVFGEDATPKVKKFMKVILDKLQHKGDGESGAEGGSLLALVGGLAQDFMKQKLDENQGFAEPALQTKMESKQEAYAGAGKRELPENGILLSGCQTDQTSADASPQGNAKDAYGAFSNAVQTILAESNGGLSNRALVEKARKLLKRQGFTQRPGLYCSDDHADAPFVC